MADDDERSIDSLPLLAEAERAQLLDAWNGAPADQGETVFAHELFEVQVRRTPDATAVTHGEERLSYAELNTLANQVAHRLRAIGVGPDDLVAIGAERGIAMVVGVLAVLKSGGAYLPLDPAYPVQRLSYLLQDSKPKVLLAPDSMEPTWLWVLAESGLDVPVLDLPAGGVRADQPGEDLSREATGLRSSHLAYVIYTSGSTGTPKGVMVPHRGLGNYLRWALAAYPAERGSVVSSSLSFDATVTSLYLPLLCGGRIVVLSEREEIDRLAAEIRRPEGCGLIKITPAHLEQLGRQVRREGGPVHVGAFVVGGEALPPATVELWRRIDPSVRLINEYGPTETVVGCVAGDVPPQLGSDRPVPIGRPIAGTRVYLLDGQQQPVPVGVTGELYVGGAGVARGYLGDPAATARSFVPDITVHGQRMYRTGDKVRRRSDGSFEYLGRLDDQVKIRGFRIEPGEVAAVLRQHPAVRESFVAAERSGPADPRLIGYVAADATPAELIGFAASRLPGYMVPAAIVVLPALPLTPNGKVDRAALPAPDRAAAGLAEVAAAERTPTEARLAGIVSRLLGAVQVGADDDFFALGGNSLLVGRLAAEIAAKLAVTLSLADVYRAPMVSAIAALIDERAGQGAAVPGVTLDSPPPMPSRLPVRPAPRDRPVPLSLQQQRVWFFEQLAPGNLAYTTQATVSLHGEVDTGALRAALDEIVRRHEVLRTAFVTVDGVAIQHLVAGLTAPLGVLDVAAEQAEEVIAAELRRPFDLTRPPLARWVLLRHGDGENTLVYAEHHIVHDGWSQGVLLSELGVLYQAFAAGEPSPLPEPAAQYADYALWQREWMQGEVLKAHVDHGVAMLAGAPHVLELPADHPRPPVKSFRGAAPLIEVPAELSRALRSFSQQHRVSLFTTMHAGFAALLYRYTGQEDLLVGTGAANRSLPELAQVLGMIVNTLVLRTKVCGQMSFTDLLDQVQQTVADTLAWPDTPVDAVIDAIGPARDASRTPLFQVMFTFHDSAVPDLDFGGLTGAVTERENGAAMCDLTVMVVPRAAQRLGREPRPEDDDLTLLWEYSTDLFDEPTMTRMAAHYLNLLTNALATPSTQIGDLRLLADSDLAMLDSWSRGPAAADGYPADATIPAQFAAQVVANPDATAVACGSTAISYAELDRRSNALAWLLRRRGVSTDTPVAVAIERGPDLITALLAVLKAGGAYLPVDPASPPPRVAAMIAAAGARLVLATDTTATTMTQLPEVDVVRVDGIGLTEPALAMDGLAAPPDAAHPLGLAYICFTSGSTGVPKGVAVPQRGVIRLISNPTFASLGPGERLLHLAPVAFDASTLEIWGALLNGSTVVVAPPGPLSLSEIAALLRTAGATVAWLTAGLFDQLAETDLDAIAGVPLVLAGGDALTPDTVRAVLAARRGRPLVNGYGPTENTTFTTCHVMTDPGQVGPTVPIGRPIQHTTVRILDDRGQPVPVGVTGELYAGGDGLARGYAGNAAATARAFVPDVTGHGTRLYRTGDLARWRGAGIIEFVGRADDQVKIRGFRVEPGEVAAVLRSHPAVRDAVVIVTGDGAQRHLIGYVTPADGQDPSTLRPAQLRDFLAQRLPDYLIPAGFKAVDRLPLNASGKVDRTALPAPDHDTCGPATPPRGATEERLAEIWSLLLPEDSARGEIGREDDFFAFGGDSLLAARLIFRIGEAFGVELGLAAFYQTRTLAACAAAIDAARNQTAPSTIGRRDRKAYGVVAPRAARQR